MVIPFRRSNHKIRLITMNMNGKLFIGIRFKCSYPIRRILCQWHVKRYIWINWTKLDISTGVHFSCWSHPYFPFNCNTISLLSTSFEFPLHGSIRSACCSVHFVCYSIHSSFTFRTFRSVSLESKPFSTTAQYGTDTVDAKQALTIWISQRIFSCGS